MLKRLLIVFLFSSVIFTAFCQSSPLPKDNPVAIAAPHLPSMIRYDGVGKIFYGENAKYKIGVNEAGLKTWSKDYPAEVLKYKDAIVSYLKSAESTTLTDKDKEVYRDLKSQWLMFLQS